MGARNDISWSDHGIPLAVKTAQARFFELAELQGFTRKVISLATNIPGPTLYDWATKPVQMPLAGFAQIISIKGFPNEVASVLIEASGKTVCDAEPEETDIDDLVVAAADLVAKYVRARHPDSPGNVHIIHTEKPGLERLAEHLADRAGKVAGA